MSSWTWWDYCIPFYCQHQFVCDHAKHLIPDVFNLLQSTEERPLVWTMTHLRYVHCPYAVCVCLFTCVQVGYIFWWDNQKWMRCNLTFTAVKQIRLSACLEESSYVWLCHPGMLTCPSSRQSNRSWKEQIVFLWRYAFLEQTVKLSSAGEMWALEHICLCSTACMCHTVPSASTLASTCYL